MRIWKASQLKELTKEPDIDKILTIDEIFRLHTRRKGKGEIEMSLYSRRGEIIHLYFFAEANSCLRMQAVEGEKRGLLLDPSSLNSFPLAGE